ncbi:MAG: hypothetical protein H7124_05215 [Phycisphaerales bacterium]|nr:hypothetical protein [Hyphomonadaceae bacterium]
MGMPDIAFHMTNTAPYRPTKGARTLAAIKSSACPQRFTRKLAITGHATNPKAAATA